MTYCCKGDKEQHRVENKEEGQREECLQDMVMEQDTTQHYCMEDILLPSLGMFSGFLRSLQR